MKAKTKFTPGKWEIFVTPSGYRLIETHDKSKGPEGRVPICRVTCDVESEELANSHLIVAAPKLYECLELMVGQTGSNLIDAQIKELLAEARGERTK